MNVVPLVLSGQGVSQRRSLLQTSIAAGMFPLLAALLLLRPLGTTAVPYASGLSNRNGTVSFQACVQNRETHFLAAKCRVTGPDDIIIQVRKVGYVFFWKVIERRVIKN